MQGHRVTVFDNFSSGSWENLSDCRDAVTVIEGELADLASLKAAMQGINTVFHQAALTSVFESIQNPMETHEINVNGTVNMLEAARLSGVQQVILASSAAIYGTDQVLPKHETMIPSPVSPYGMSKLVNEFHARLYAETYGLNAVCLRYFNVFGPRQNPKSQYSGVISCFADALMQGHSPVIYGDGHQSRDFVHVQDVIQANLLAMRSQKFSFETFNVGYGKGSTLLDILSTLFRQSGMHPDVEYREERRGDIRHSIACIERITDVLGFRPTMTIENGLKQYWESLQGAAEAPSQRPTFRNKTLKKTG